MRVFLDTNVLVAALATRGLCAEIFEIVIQSHELLSSQDVLEELGRILPKKLKISEDIVAGFINLIRDEAEMLVPGDTTPSVSDPDDVPILAAALNRRAEAFVTGDKTLLEIKDLSRVKIVSPREFADLLLVKPSAP